MKIRNHEMLFGGGLDDGRGKRVLGEIELCLGLGVIGWIVRNISQHRSRRHRFVERFEPAIEIRHSESVAFAQIGVRGYHIQQEPQAGGQRDTNQDGDCESMTAQDVQFSTDWLPTATVSTYLVGFLLFLAEYFWWYAFRSMFTALRTGFVKTSTLQKLATTSRLREPVTEPRPRGSATTNTALLFTFPCGRGSVAHVNALFSSGYAGLGSRCRSSSGE